MLLKKMMFSSTIIAIAFLLCSCAIMPFSSSNFGDEYVYSCSVDVPQSGSVNLPFVCPPDGRKSAKLSLVRAHAVIINKIIVDGQSIQRRFLNILVEDKDEQYVLTSLPYIYQSWSNFDFLVDRKKQWALFTTDEEGLTYWFVLPNEFKTITINYIVYFGKDDHSKPCSMILHKTDTQGSKIP